MASLPLINFNRAGAEWVQKIRPTLSFPGGTDGKNGVNAC
jgi:hypothetical protein